MSTRDSDLAVERVGDVVDLRLFRFEQTTRLLEEAAQRLTTAIVDNSRDAALREVSKIRRFVAAAFVVPEDGNLWEFIERKPFPPKSMTGHNNFHAVVTFLRQLRTRITVDDVHPSFLLPMTFKQFATHNGEWPSFHNELPRVYELKEMLVGSSHPDAYFQNFEKELENSTIKLNAFRKFEGWLAALDDAAWQDLKQRAAPDLVSRQRESGRGWQEFFDIINEAKAFGHLQSIGCTEVHFIPRTVNKKTPDLGASLDGRSVFCEVKTINISDDEAEKRSRNSVVSSRSQDVSEGFLKKLSDTLAKAVEQLDAADPKRQARRMIFTMLHFDDWWGDCQARHIAQIDAHLLQYPVDGKAELVFCLKPNLSVFERPPTMISATICFE